MRGTGSPQFGKRTPVNGKLAAAPPMHSPRSAGGIIRCICENNIDRGTMIQCEVGTPLEHLVLTFEYLGDQAFLGCAAEPVHP